MNEVACHLIENVIPQVQVRQWVISFPFNIRYLLAYNPALVTETLTIFIRIVSNWYEKRARKLGHSGKTAAVTFVQKFGDGLRSNTHFHSLFIDGVFDVSVDPPVFYPVPHPTDEEVGCLVKRVRDRVLRAFKTRGLLEGAMVDEHEPELFQRLTGNSIQQRITLGERAGLKVRRIGAIKGLDNVFRIANRCATIDGFSLHADTKIKADERDRLEKLLRYTARPAIALERLSETEDGKILYRLKKYFSDGTSHFLFDPLEFVEKVMAIIPPARANLLRYHLLYAPHSKYRAKIVPQKKEKSPNEVPEHRRKTWAQLLSHSFAVDVLKCDQCAGKMEPIAIIVDPAIIKRILNHLGLPSEAPFRSLPRAPPQGMLVDQEYSQCVGFTEAW